jgi:hypothetical protein
MYYENVVQDMKRRAYVELGGEKIVFTERLWNMLAGLRLCGETSVFIHDLCY